MSALAGGPVQIAYCVSDVESAALEWTETHGAGPFFVRHHIPVTDVLMRGAPAAFDHSSAYGQWGSLMVELVAVHHPPSLATAGLHHVAYIVDSFEAASAELIDRGWEQALVATAGSTGFAFHDAQADLGHLVEIYQRSPALVGFYEMVAAAAEGWTGADPVRAIA